MTEKQFKVHAEEYQDTDDMGYAIAPPIIYYHVGNSKIGFNFDTEKEAKMLCEAWNKLVEENEQSKMMIATLRNMVLDQEDLEKENKELKEKNEFVGLLANHRGRMVSFANVLIQDLDDEKTQEIWEKFRDKMYNEWKQKRGME